MDISIIFFIEDISIIKGKKAVIICFFKWKLWLFVLFSWVARYANHPCKSGRVRGQVSILHRAPRGLTLEIFVTVALGYVYLNEEAASITINTGNH